MSDDKQHRIRERAHAIWESQGRPDGYHEEHWLMATKEIEAESPIIPAVKKPRAKAAPKASAAPKAPAAKKPAAKAKK